MTTENKRDLAADLSICEAATDGPWEIFLSGSGYYIHAVDYSQAGGPIAIHENAVHIAEAREGWPHAIRRAMAAEKAAQEFADIINVKQADVERLQAEVLFLRDQRDSLEATLQHYRGYA